MSTMPPVHTLPRAHIFVSSALWQGPLPPKRLKCCKVFMRERATDNVCRKCGRVASDAERCHTRENLARWRAFCDASYAESLATRDYYRKNEPEHTLANGLIVTRRGAAQMKRWPWGKPRPKKGAP